MASSPRGVRSGDQSRIKIVHGRFHPISRKARGPRERQTRAKTRFFPPLLRLSFIKRKRSRAPRYKRIAPVSLYIFSFLPRRIRRNNTTDVGWKKEKKEWGRGGFRWSLMREKTSRSSFRSRCSGRRRRRLRRGKWLSLAKMKASSK